MGLEYREVPLGLFPAGAGVIPGPDGGGHPGRPVPRRGGGDPASLSLRQIMDICSPQGRG